jgi:hypothetical protein
MTQAEATSIISTFAIDHDSGILEALEYMQGVYNEGHDEWSEQFSIKERQAYWIVMEGMREMFLGNGE